MALTGTGMTCSGLGVSRSIMLLETWWYIAGRGEDGGSSGVIASFLVAARGVPLGPVELMEK